MQIRHINNNRSSRVARGMRLMALVLGASAWSSAWSFAGAMQVADMSLSPNTPGVLAADAANPPTLAEITAILSGQFRVAHAESATIAHAVLEAANRFAMSPVLLLGVIATESGFNRRAVSPAGAKGLMQVLPSAHPQLLAGGADLSDPAINVAIGSSILRGYLDAAGGDLNSALSRYSGGGKGYAKRVALHMQLFSERLHAQPDAFVKVALVEAR